MIGEEELCIAAAASATLVKPHGLLFLFDCPSVISIATRNIVLSLRAPLEFDENACESAQSAAGILVLPPLYLRT